jgi:hypothetical protein
MCFVNDIMSEDGKFLSIDLLETKFNISKNMKFNSIISAVAETCWKTECV